MLIDALTTEYLGRLHPLMVHIPIALVAAAVIAEFAAACSRRFQVTVPFSLLIAAAGSVAALATGWQNAAHQEFQGELSRIVELHRWSGVILTLLLAATALSALSAMAPILRRTLLIATVGITVVTGHLGGSLVHGVDYLALDRPQSPESAPPPASPESSVRSVSQVSSEDIVFDRDIHPLFEKHCNRCHGDGRSKGDFNLDTREAFLRGGKGGAAIVIGDAAKSRLMRLVRGEEPKKVMPSKGRRLYAEEIALLGRWIDAGAPWGRDKPRVLLPKPSITLDQHGPLSSEDSARHPIDTVLAQYERGKDLGIPPRTDDRLFVRRAYLDLWGRLPSPDEFRAFIEDPRPSKRLSLVDHLLSNNFLVATHWLSFWNDLLRNDYTGTGYVDRGRNEITEWLFTTLARNIPLDEMLRGLVRGDPGAEGFVQGIVWRGVVLPNERPEMQAAQNLGQIFLGVNLKCASCHDSFIDKWTLDDAYGFANVFAKDPLEAHRCDQATGRRPVPRFLYPELGGIDPAMTVERRRAALADIMTDRSNGLLAKTLANRIWAQLFGHGIVHPVDEMSRLPWSPELLNLLASTLQEYHYDQRAFLRFIMTSEAYQRRALPTIAPAASDEQFAFRGPMVRRLTAEQFIATAHDVAGVPLVPGGFESARFIAATSALIRDGTIRQDQVYRGSLVVSSALTTPRQMEDVSLDLKGARTLWLISHYDEAFAERDLSRSGIVWADAVIHTPSGDIPLGDPRLRRLDSEEKAISFTAMQQGKPLRMRGQLVQRGFFARAPSALVIDLRGLHATSFSARVALSGKPLLPSDGIGTFRIYAVTDLKVPASFDIRTPLAAALGRLPRDTPVTSRPQLMTTMDAMELLNNTDLHRLIEQGARRAELRTELKSQGVITKVFSDTLNRAPTKEELATAQSLVGSPPNTEGLADLWWSMLLHPDFTGVY